MKNQDSNDGAIREGDPPYVGKSSHPAGAYPDVAIKIAPLRWLGWSAFVGLTAGMLVGAVWGYVDFDAEPAPILSCELVMLIGAIFLAPVGAIVGITLGSVLMAFFSASVNQNL